MFGPICSEYKVLILLSITSFSMIIYFCHSYFFFQKKGKEGETRKMKERIEEYVKAIFSFMITIVQSLVAELASKFYKLGAGFVQK